MSDTCSCDTCQGKIVKPIEIVWLTERICPDELHSHRIDKVSGRFLLRKFTAMELEDIADEREFGLL